MRISVHLRNQGQTNDIQLETDGSVKHLAIPSKSEGKGSSVNGGELLFAALATCACNDIYREAAKQQLQIESVEVTVNGEFGKEGEPGENMTYNIRIKAPGLKQEEISALIEKVDRIVEIHNTIRLGREVRLRQ